MDSIIEDVLPAGIRYLRTRERVYNASSKTASTVDSIWQTKRPAKSAFVNKKFAVLINEGSASASEIFAIALKDGMGVPLYGAKSYGKAIGQIELRRRERLGLKITFAHFYRIVNLDNKVYEDYHRIGITPDTVSDLLQRQSIGISDKPLFYAIKTLQPSIAKIEIQYPLSKRRTPVTASGNGLQKIVNESDLY
jgi:C-terminal processing protease CtpA/Prc